MKIAIIGSRGIPNHYGGFEQFAEYLSRYLADIGHDITVYNSHTHPYQDKVWNGVKICHQYDLENKLGTIGQFIYDLNCILDTRKKDFDVILQLGYTSSSVWGFLLPRQSVIITNMDGLEWKRTKFSKSVQRFLKWAESLAVSTSDYLISDSKGIQDYISKKYKVESEYIAYGAYVFTTPDKEILKKFSVTEGEYDMLIARLEPENSIEIILDGVAAAKNKRSFLVIGNHKTQYGNYLVEKYKSIKNIQFLGPVYDMEQLNNLRHYSNLYFHGHTVGGTNPSLLEAMGSGAFICANNNIFNSAILGEDALYFNNSIEVKDIIETFEKKNSKSISAVKNNIEKIKSTYSWNIINNQYLKFMEKCLREKNALKLQSA